MTQHDVAVLMRHEKEFHRADHPKKQRHLKAHRLQYEMFSMINRVFQQLRQFDNELNIMPRADLKAVMAIADLDLIATFMENYRFEPKLEVVVTEFEQARIHHDKLQTNIWHQHRTSV